MTAASTPPLHVLRGILRLTKSAPSKPTPVSAAAAATAQSPASFPPTNDEPTTLRQHVMAQYRLSRSLPPREAKIKRQMAHDFYLLKRDLMERARLHDLDQGADEKLSPRELSRRAAARAGLQLPKLDSE
mmetsp:Transcript_38952/g.83123  ORF Transcript_38952/g.83123 Transcript_38952/m.83123 type:complete len:130 (-) Transcript_38952:286-675(-)|eukprot:CAMPEP_0172529322 /NCGR_PEP_ID=MMETSP1067-20121228/3428_1 /TAXON_ID=265564 ORGANISM="Thalassiosira punctigera, Strain Tpunct2005C2" /NCGR_SAMPLE_ID=MMETSP1067 /ASSEMBLY_ACC=CAM_ASM_000444 /LENGTH=129 /DNA_ID=CAMNT_0013313353 /DNA_START=124 /DNA_END=513 /DNA_ORIENTATION=+